MEMYVDYDYVWMFCSCQEYVVCHGNLSVLKIEKVSWYNLKW